MWKLGSCGPFTMLGLQCDISRERSTKLISETKWRSARCHGDSTAIMRLFSGFQSQCQLLYGSRIQCKWFQNYAESDPCKAMLRHFDTCSLTPFCFGSRQWATLDCSCILIINFAFFAMDTFRTGSSDTLREKHTFPSVFWETMIRNCFGKHQPRTTSNKTAFGLSLDLSRNRFWISSALPLDSHGMPSGFPPDSL